MKKDPNAEQLKTLQGVFGVARGSTIYGEDFGEENDAIVMWPWIIGADFFGFIIGTAGGGPVFGAVGAALLSLGMWGLLAGNA